MEYFSTRDTQLKIPSAKAIAQGLSRDGGLFVPKEIPAISDGELKMLVDASYSERAAFILGKYLTDFSADELKEYTHAAYSFEHFPTEKTAPVHMLNANTAILELWHGPTCAFKDMALQILPYLLTAALKKTGETKTACILVATSGDTGKAALQGFADVEGTKIAVFYPKDGVSRVQELQMTTQEGANVYVSSVHGNFDNVQSKLKELFSDTALREKAAAKGVFFSSANSINWGRAVPQIAYYVSGYCDLVKSGTIQMGQEINICVPTGNFGNILAAYYAKLMGIPVKKLICASNENNVLTDFFNTGRYDKRREFYTTSSPAMDILISSNLERLLFDLCENDDSTIKKYMAHLASDGTYTVSDDIKAKLGELFFADWCSDSETLDTIRDAFSEYKYLSDTHTAVGLNVTSKYRAATSDDTLTLVASTASPFKFADSVLKALGVDSGIDGLSLLDILAKTTEWKLPEPLAKLRDKKERFVNCAAPEELSSVIASFM